MTQHYENTQVQLESAGFASEYNAIDAGISATFGSMGLSKGFGAMGIGMSSISTTSAVVGRSAYGLKKFVDK